jgi:tetrahydromethanopterin S-methyltransferase subunit H
MLDVVGSSPESIKKFIGLVADITDASILIDGVSANVRITGLKYAYDVGLGDKIIYNSINSKTAYSKIEAIKEIGIKNVILLELK